MASARQPTKIAYSETFHFPNCTVHVHYPDISNEENERRKKLIRQAAVELFKDKLKGEREREKAKQQELLQH